MENSLTQTGFDKFLAALDDDRERAGVKYEFLRARLVKFFEWRNCERAEELSDEVFDRVVKKIKAGEQIENFNAYLTGVAQFVFKEEFRRERLFEPLDANAEIENPAANQSETIEANARFDCLEKCLAEFSTENRRLVTDYYDTDERTMIESRKRLADSLNISLNTLRIRVCRLKAKLEDCTKNCCTEVQS